MEFDIADPPLPIMEFSIIFYIFFNEGFPKAEVIYLFLLLDKKLSIILIGIGKMIVELCSAEMLPRVCR